MNIKNALLYSSAAFAAPRMCSYVCDHSHPLLDEQDYFLNRALPKWLVHVCHAERAYYDATNHNTNIHTWHISVYDSLWLTVLIVELCSVSSPSKRFGQALGLSLVVEMTRSVAQRIFPLPLFLRTSSEELGFLTMITSCLTYQINSLEHLFLFGVLDFFFMTYFPIARAFDLPTPSFVQQQHPELFFDSEVGSLDQYYSAVEIDTLPEDEQMDPISHEPMTHPVKLHVCDHLFDQASIDPWLRINPTCPLCRAHIHPRE